MLDSWKESRLKKNIASNLPGRGGKGSQQSAQFAICSPLDQNSGSVGSIGVCNFIGEVMISGVVAVGHQASP